MQGNNVSFYDFYVQNRSSSQDKCLQATADVCIPSNPQAIPRYFPMAPSSGDRLGNNFYNNIHPPLYGWREQYRTVTDARRLTLDAISKDK